MSTLFGIDGTPAPSRRADGTGAAPAARAVAHSIVNRVAIQAINFATGTLTARALHPAGRGQLAAMILWPLFLANATALGTPSSLIFHLRRKPQLRGPFVASALTMVTLLGIVASGIGALVLPRWLHEYPPDIIRWAQWFLLVAPLWAVQITGQAALEAMELFSLSNLVQLLIPVTTLSGLLLFLSLHRLTPVTAAFAYSFAIVPTAITILALLWRHRVNHRMGGAISFSLAACRTLLGYGVRSAPLDLLGTLSLYLDQALVVRFLSPAEMGSYAVVLSLSRAMLVFQAAVVMVLFPRAAGRKTDEIVEMVGKPLRINAILTGSAAIFVGLVGPVLLKLVYGAEYLDAVPALRVLMCEVVLQGGVVVMSQAFMAAGRPGVVSLLQGTGLSLAVPLMVVLIPRYGLTGAAVSLLLSTCARFCFIFVSFRIFLKTRLPQVVPGRADLETLWMLARARF